MDASRLGVFRWIMRGISTVVLGAMLAGCSAVARDPAHVQDAGRPASALELRQQETGAAYRRLEQVRYELRFAEQDWLNANAAYQRAQKSADELKLQADTAQKAYAAAQAKEAQARAAYEQAIQAVDDAYRSGAASGKR